MSEELKPCPFCGCTKINEYAESVDVGDEYANIFNYIVECPDCQCSRGDSRTSDVIKRWNTRPAEDALKAEVERLKNKLALVKKHIVDNRDALLFVLKSEHDRATYCEFAFCQSLIELINTDTGKGGEDE